MLTTEKLRAYGADVDEGLARCMNNEAFYLRLVNMGLEDENFQKLRDALERDDRKGGFEAAHALKGVLANLSLTPLLVPVSEVTELLRAGKDADYAAYWERIQKQRAALQAMRDEA